MRIRTVRIENFKRFELLDEIELRELDCLVGTNNSGKTTLLQALSLFNFCLHHCLTKKNGHFEFTRRTVAPEDFYVLPFTDPIEIWTNRRAIRDKKQLRVQITVTFDSGLRLEANVKLDFNRFGISIVGDSLTADQIDALRQFRIAYLPVFSMFQAREERRTSTAIDGEIASGRVNSVIRNLLLELKRQEKQSRLEAILQASFPHLKNLKIEFDEHSDRYINVTYKESGRPKPFDIFSAGSGFQQFMYLFGFILLREPNVILLDEPDVHLHGSLQRGLLAEFQNLVEHEGRQVIFATHSRDLISQVSPQNILYLSDGRVERLSMSMDVYEALHELGSIDNTQLGAMQAFRRVVIVEDESDRDMLATFLTTCLGAEVWQQIERRVAFCFSKGNPWKQLDVVRLQKILQQMMAVPNQTLELFVIADRDYHPDLAQLLVTRPSNHIAWHVWERSEIENYLLCPAALKRLARGSESEPTLFETRIAPEFERLIEESRDTAHDKLVRAFEELRRQQKETWDSATMSRKAREYLRENWNNQKLGLADAKEVVLPGLNRWMKENGLGQFTHRRLAQELNRDEIPNEVHELGCRLAEFAGVRKP